MMEEPRPAAPWKALFSKIDLKPSSWLLLARSRDNGTQVYVFLTALLLVPLILLQVSPALLQPSLIKAGVTQIFLVKTSERGALELTAPELTELRNRTTKLVTSATLSGSQGHNAAAHNVTPEVRRKKARRTPPPRAGKIAEIGKAMSESSDRTSDGTKDEKTSVSARATVKSDPTEAEELGGNEATSESTRAGLGESPERIQGTSIVGKEAGKAFREKLRCMSEEGHWVLNKTPRWIPFSIASSGKIENCDILFANNTEGAIVNQTDSEAAQREGREWKVRKDLLYEWRMKRNASCQYKQFDRSAFCKELGKKASVVVVGDSLSSHFSMAFLNHILRPDSPEVAYARAGLNAYGLGCRNFDCGPFRGCDDVLGGQDNAVRFRYVRNDNLLNNTEWRPFTAPWLSLIERWEPSLLILNRGAHYENDTLYREGVETAMREVRKRFPDLLVVWRTTSPGHVLNNNPDVLDVRQSDFRRKKNTNLPYNWAKFQHQNEIARGIVRRYGAVYMDIDPMTSLRADGHIPLLDRANSSSPWIHTRNDCLHYCVPGPMNAWVTMLYNVLRLVRKW